MSGVFLWEGNQFSFKFFKEFFVQILVFNKFSFFNLETYSTESQFSSLRVFFGLFPRLFHKIKKNHARKLV
jgi:hypothetical protein